MTNAHAHTKRFRVERKEYIFRLTARKIMIIFCTYKYSIAHTHTHTQNDTNCIWFLLILFYAIKSFSFACVRLHPLFNSIMIFLFFSCNYVVESHYLLYTTIHFNISKNIYLIKKEERETYPFCSHHSPIFFSLLQWLNKLWINVTGVSIVVELTRIY